ncbi:MAG: putative bifunctional diguanylate cyclase/phosphodiesterase, partial [Burkholderiales bacterium]
GNQFAVVLGSVASASQVTQLGERAMQAILKPFTLEGREVVVGASAGIALALKESSAEELLHNAEAALHDAKGSGKGTVRLFRPYMIDRVKQRLNLEQALKTALEQEAFTLHYQPQVDAVTQKLLGVEALIRWHHPKLGDIPPSQFIPLAEETGIIVALGAWVLRKACTDARAWQSWGLKDVAVAVNVSARQFHEPGFADTVLNTLAQTQLYGSLLELELTESMLLDRNGLHVAELAALRQQGVSFAIDDFGTGYSSLSVLKHFPLQRLKIDRSFVKNIPYESDDVAIASAVIALGHKMGLEVVAEGVETQSQYEYLKDQACDRIQGYLFSRPLPLEELLAKYAGQGAPAVHQADLREPKLVFSR